MSYGENSETSMLNASQIAPDGHCMFNAIADQLYCLGMVEKKHVSLTSTSLLGLS